MTVVPLCFVELVDCLQTIGTVYGLCESRQCIIFGLEEGSSEPPQTPLPTALIHMHYTQICTIFLEYKQNVMWQCVTLVRT